ncbi:SDR family oxidoreductase [Actinospica durhamensis]|uniref:SDR family oxidoreductase n=1 Tax=Actinospica durhamensis TaxID=1508375 RepID=A0A941IPA5_9ACTN|nr:SDR family NAD(P)-dependent oxidoreductase [Actinospica durhamensis]MBR7836310.1 SDR family oxidoreductase [Actinospica durhamensis]
MERSEFMGGAEQTGAQGAGTGRLDGKVALISGTGRGMGRAAALEFAARGARVFGCDLDAGESERTVALVRAAGGEMAALAPVDLATAEGAKAWVAGAVERFGGVDVLYNNASALRNGPLMELTDDEWHFTIKNELDLVWYSVRAAWPELVRRGGGSIVNVASIAAKLGARFVGQVPHGSAKGGVLAMTKHLCAAGGEHGIRANAILPGLIYTPETARFIDDPDGPLPGILAKIPLGRYGRAEEVAKLAAFLAGDDAAFITGAEIAIDGGDGSVAA